MNSQMIIYLVCALQQLKEPLVICLYMTSLAVVICIGFTFVEGLSSVENEAEGLSSSTVEEQQTKLLRKYLKLSIGLWLILMFTITVIPTEKTLLKMYFVPKVVKYVDVVEKYVDKYIEQEK